MTIPTTEIAPRIHPLNEQAKLIDETTISYVHTPDPSLSFYSKSIVVHITDKTDICVIRSAAEDTYYLSRLVIEGCYTENF